MPHPAVMMSFLRRGDSEQHERLAQWRAHPTQQRPSMNYCVDGKLVLFLEAAHWVQRDEAETIAQELLEFPNK